MARDNSAKRAGGDGALAMTMAQKRAYFVQFVDEMSRSPRSSTPLATACIGVIDPDQLALWYGPDGFPVPRDTVEIDGTVAAERQVIRGRTLLAGLAVMVLWASAFPAIRVASPELGVIGLPVVRLGIAAVALLVLAVPARQMARPG